MSPAAPESTLQGEPGWLMLWNVAQLAYRALWKCAGTPAYLQLARILERTGRPAEAREAYQFVAFAWRHADPELQPLVAEARQAVARLSRAENQPGG